jgi:hypothetical protein
MIDWQLIIVGLIVIFAVAVIVKSICFGPKESKCHNCSNNPAKCNL